MQHYPQMHTGLGAPPPPGPLSGAQPNLHRPPPMQPAPTSTPPPITQPPLPMPPFTQPPLPMPPFTQHPLPMPPFTQHPLPMPHSPIPSGAPHLPQQQTTSSGQGAEATGSVKLAYGNNTVEYTSKLRTPDEARADARLDLALIGDFPQGPFDLGREALRDRLVMHTKKPETGGGGFGLRYQSEAVVAKKKRGDVVKLHCAKARCNWYVKYEHTSCGFVLTGMSLDKSKEGEHGHSHELLHTDAEVLAAREVKKTIPDELWELALDVSKTCPISVVNRVLIAKAKDLGITAGWTEDYLRNRLNPGVPVNDLELKDLMELLRERKDTLNLAFFVQTDAEHVFERIWIEMEGAQKTWAHGGNDNVLLFDPTWGTNKEGHKLCCFVTIDLTGATVIIAVAILKEETLLSFEWAFLCFAKVCLHLLTYLVLAPPHLPFSISTPLPSFPHRYFELLRCLFSPTVIQTFHLLTNI